jgi:signal transduction histidine kinase
VPAIVTHHHVGLLPNRELRKIPEPVEAMDHHEFYDGRGLATDVRINALDGGGEMGAVMRSIDWSKTDLGPVESWSDSLRMMVRFLLANRFPLLLWWGPNYVQLYNDAYRPVLGIKHPRAMGQPCAECWTEIWPTIGPLIDTPYNGGPSTWMEDIALVVERHGYLEETHFTIAYSPVPDATAPRGIGGVLATVHEITDKVVGERRLAALRDLGEHSLMEAQTPEAACAAAAEILAAHALDVSFALIYLFDDDGGRARLVGAAGVKPGAPISPSVLSFDERGPSAWPLPDKDGDAMRVVDRLEGRFGDVPAGPWFDSPTTAVVLPIPSNRAHRPAGVLVVGLSTRQRLDDGYRGFLELLTAQIATAIANARAYEEEKRRAESLAELDRAKTRFFSNVSHEFRTPLTLMLGPLRETLERGNVTSEVRDELVVVQRNALRLLKLVNTLLEFSRLEAGRIEAVYQPVDLAAYSAELASTFRSAFEKAGVRLSVDCPGLAEDVYVDRDMWEKIVMNLLSNAFKHTFEGEVTVRVRADDEFATLEVCDTGVGIPADQLPHVFERFHRVVNTRSRTHEGTGIGLALVHDLVHLHGGEVSVESEEGVGTTFIVRIPFGVAHLPAERIGAARTRGSTALGVAPFVEEALRWLPHENGRSVDASGVAADGAFERQGLSVDEPTGLVLLVDDNADMRDYVTGLLCDRGWSVEPCANGLEALEAARVTSPDIVVTDVMMPGLDGFGLLRALRADPQTREIPVIMLSARAGEEPRIEGLDAGADDYLVKPFSAHELVARIRAHVRLARARAEAADQIRRAKQRLSVLVEQAPVAVAVLRGPKHVFEIANDFYSRAVGRSASTLIGKPFSDAFADLDLHEHAEHLDRVFTTGESMSLPEESAPVLREDGRAEEGFFNIVYQPLRDEHGKVDSIAVVGVEVTPLVRARAAAESANADKMQFLAAMSHELRTPLNAIAGYADLLQLGIHGAVNEEQRQVIGRMQRSGQRLLALINDVLNFAKLERGRVDYEIEDVNLAMVIGDVTTILEPAFSEAQLAFSAHVDPVVTVRADREKLGQILLNLLSNSVKFTNAGGRIAVELGRRTEMPSDVVFVRVSDTGIGIPRERLSAIFDPFVQVHRSLTRPTEGTGLGLAISRDLARAMGGDLRARSVEGQGSTFTLTLRQAGC